ncbi:MAG: iron transporter [Hyphomicrobiales bacterium]|nr:iron transporter [Hyphomicrobiales bacterium]MBV8826046.1 iron transporter [Hyphomicrobiales bacterium]
MRTGPLSALVLAAALVALISSAGAKEYPIGKPKTANGMEISAVYLQPIEMEPPGMMRAAADSDIHLEADIKATKGNANGFPEGDWVPYLVVHYELTKLDGGQVIKGELMPMVANDGPHYGDNVKLMGPGKYKLTVTVSPPSENTHAPFGRHVDKETGVGPWFKTFSADYEFVFAGTGKKGAY